MHLTKLSKVIHDGSMAHAPAPVTIRYLGTEKVVGRASPCDQAPGLIAQCDGSSVDRLRSGGLEARAERQVLRVLTAECRRRPLALGLVLLAGGQRAVLGRGATEVVAGVILPEPD
jgi:hypothetical protein